MATRLQFKSHFNNIYRRMGGDAARQGGPALMKRYFCLAELTDPLNWPLVERSPYCFLPLHVRHHHRSSCPPLLRSLLFSFSPPLALHKAHTIWRYLKEQITMATISHIVITHTRLWWLFFILEGLPKRPYLAGAAPTNLFWGTKGTMLPSVGSACFAHGGRLWKTPSAPLWQHTAANHMPIRLRGHLSLVFRELETEVRHGSSSFGEVTTPPQLYLPFRKVIGWKKQRVCLPACRFCYELQPCTV